MANDDSSRDDPLDFVRNMWGSMGFTLPGMMTPTLDVEELDKRIADMHAVEGWLRMNLNMLQMTIQGLEMQRATIAAVQAMREQQAPQKEATAEAPADNPNPFAAATMWPWNMVQTDSSRQAGAEKTEKAGTSRAKPRAKRKTQPKGG